MMTTETPNPMAKPMRWYLVPFETYNQIILKVAARLGGQKPKELERFLKFATVGIIGAIIDFGVLNLLQATILHPEEPHVTTKVALATGTAFVSAVASNFMWNRYWTYPDSRSRSVQRQLVQFFIVNTAGLAFRLVWVRVMFGPFGALGADIITGLGGASLTNAVQVRLGTNIAQFFAVWMVMVWNFFVNRYWTYSDVE